MNLTEIAAAFSHPWDDGVGAAFGALAGGRASAQGAQTASWFESAGRHDLARSLRAFTPDLRRGPWRPEFGLGAEARQQGKADQAALQLALAFAAMRGEGEMRAQLPEPTPLFFSGNLIWVSGRTELLASGGAVELSCDGARFGFVRTENVWHLERGGPPLWSVQPLSELGGKYVISTDAENRDEAFPWPVQHRSAASDAVLASDAACVAEAWRVLVNLSPRYAPWVHRVLSGVLFTTQYGDRSQSSSSSTYLGLAAMSRLDDPVAIAEVLVHECSHQYLHLINSVAPIVSAGDAEMGYSPVKRLVRPMFNVLVGAHAVGNMILFHRDVAARRPEPRHMTRLARLEGWFREDYAPALDRSRTLSPSGQALWDRLRDGVMALEAA